MLQGNKPRHVKQECPLANKFSKFFKKKKGKAMKATWSDIKDCSSKEDEEVEEMENVCLMEREDEHSSDGENEVIENFTLDELHDASDDLHDKF